VINLMIVKALDLDIPGNLPALAGDVIAWFGMSALAGVSVIGAERGPVRERSSSMSGGAAPMRH